MTVFLNEDKLLEFNNENRFIGGYRQGSIHTPTTSSSKKHI
ncbi:hypothetical protein MASR2M15_21680 [Anaerolineales bacterium]